LISVTLPQPMIPQRIRSIFVTPCTEKAKPYSLDLQGTG
jgi:hypothetical protein